MLRCLLGPVVLFRQDPQVLDDLIPARPDSRPGGPEAFHVKHRRDGLCISPVVVFGAAAMIGVALP
jgi:hypothetical protein